MSRRLTLVLCSLTCAALLLAGCHRGLVRRVSEPAASLQQVSVGADGQWQVQLRLQNYSSIPMRYDTVALAVTAGGVEAGTLKAAPGFSIGPESADVVEVRLSPSAEARMAVANALAGGTALEYTLNGSVQATPEDEKQRDFQIDMHSTLSPAPGLAGVLR